MGSAGPGKFQRRLSAGWLSTSVTSVPTGHSRSAPDVTPVSSRCLPFIMDKFVLRQQVLERLADDLTQAEQAVRVAHEAATHEENIAENKYDTLGLEAAYLATGQARRVEAIRQAMAKWRHFQPGPYDASKGIQLGALVCLVDSDDSLRCCRFIEPQTSSRRFGQGLRWPPKSASGVSACTMRAPAPLCARGRPRLAAAMPTRAVTSRPERPGVLDRRARCQLCQQFGAFIAASSHRTRPCTHTAPRHRRCARTRRSRLS